MNFVSFDDFFQGQRRNFLLRSIRLALEEDGLDLTSRAVFSPEHHSSLWLVSKQEAVLAGLPLVPIVLTEAEQYEPGPWRWQPKAAEGGRVHSGDPLAVLEGSTRLLLKAERIILNFLTHLSGVASLTARYVEALEGTGVRLLDTRKTLPGLRAVEKYAVLLGGGQNHRFSLEDMLMLKDNHIDAAGSIRRAVELLRAACSPCPPVEVECRNQAEVLEAVAAGVNRIMLDNMEPAAIGEALAVIPRHIETEVSGGVSLENIAALVRVPGADAAGSGLRRNPDFVSVGRLTHSAPVADFSLRFCGPEAG